VRALLDVQEDAKEGQAVIVAVDTSFIPHAQRALIQPLLSELYRVGGREGFDNILFVHGSGDELAAEISKACEATGTPSSRVVILASEQTYASGALKAFTSTEEEERALIALVDASTIADFGCIRIMEMVSRAMKLLMDESAAASMPEREVVREGRKIYRFIPNAEPMDFQRLQERYRAYRTALAAA